MRGHGPWHPGVNTGNSFGKRRCSLRGILVQIQGPEYSRAAQKNFGNQKCRRLRIFEQEQTVLKYEQPTPGEGQKNQVCDLCKVEPGNKVTISQEWQTALWVAEKQVVTRIQPLVHSPILTRYAGAAYSLRQKPWGWCCKACENWVFKSGAVQ